MSNEELNREKEFENQEWIDSLEYVIQSQGEKRALELLTKLKNRAFELGVAIPNPLNTPHINSIPANKELPYPGNRELEKRIKSIIRWNAMAMVVRANKESEGIGGHISSFASSASLYEVGFNHFWKGPDHPDGPDFIYIQGHTAPGIYSRSFLEGRINEKDLLNFRHELRKEGGLSSYPHPRFMDDYWQFPTVSMGLGPITAIYHARFMRYLEDKGLKPKTKQKIWAMLGDGEMDEPESLGAITLPPREKLDNLIFVVNCNLQRLDGPVRGNGNIINELESAFRGAGWNVIKVIWGSGMDPLLEKDEDGMLLQRMGELVDGEYQKFAVEDGGFVRRYFFNKYPSVARLVENMSDEDIKNIQWGGHDPVKIYNAYHAAVNHEGQPTVILVRTVKGYGLGEAGEGKNITHQQKKLNEEELLHFRNRFSIPVSDSEVAKAPFYKPADNSEEMHYLLDRRKKLGGFLPTRNKNTSAIQLPDISLFSEFFAGSGDRELATTMVVVQIMTKLLKDKEIGKLIVPIVPDESRTFGMDALFRQVGIYSHVGQLYEPVDKESLLYYKESRNGAILEEGITEAGSMSSFIAAGTAYSMHGINTIPFFIYYSMFGFQRIGDFVWAAADARARGFMIGGTSGRTTLAGEGLQHCDGHSHVIAMTVPNVKAYDPAFAFEVAVIIREGIREMYVEQQDVIYYVTVMNEKYLMPPMPDNIENDIIKGLYRFRQHQHTHPLAQVNLLGSGAIMNEVLKAADILKNEFNIAADIWSVTSYKQLYDDARETSRWNRLNPGNKRKSHIQTCFENKDGIFIAATDYMKMIPLSIAKWIPGKYTVLGTDGFGRSDDRKSLRDYFEVDAKHIVWATLSSLHENNTIDIHTLMQAANKLGIKPEKQNPAIY